MRKKGNETTPAAVDPALMAQGYVLDAGEVADQVPTPNPLTPRLVTALASAGLDGMSSHLLITRRHY